MDGIECDDPVQVINAWPENAKGKVHHFTSGGDLAYVVFNKPHFDQGNWWEYNWYTRDQLVKLAPQEPRKERLPDETIDEHRRFLHALFPANYATFEDAMRASGADGEE